MSFKSLTFLNKSFHFIENVLESLSKKASKSFKMSQINEKCLHLSVHLKSLEFFETTSHHFKKASSPLKMSSKSLKKTLFVFKKPLNFYKSLTKASISLKMSIQSLKIVQNALHYWKKP
jgi:hypothetical protein